MTRDMFHSQVQLSTKKYIDNNNFIRVNKGTNKYDRFNTFVPEEEFQGYDFVKGPPWTGSNYLEYANRSMDGGKTYLNKKLD